MRRSPDGGFTLLEAAVALAIVSLVAVALLAEFGAELRSMERGGTALVASALARDRLDAVRLLPAEARESLPDSLREGRFAPPLDLYTWRTTLRVSSDDDELLDVRVEVEGPGGVERLATRLYRPRRSPGP